MKKVRLNAGAVELTVAMLVAGTIGVFVEESHQAVLNVVFYRCLFGAIFLGLFCYLKGYFKEHNLTLLRFGLAVFGGVSIIVNWVLIFKSFSLTSIALGTIVYNTQPFFVVLLGALVLKATVSKDKIGWIVIAFLGLLLVTKLEFSTLSVNSSYGVGIVCALLAAIFYAIATIIAKCLKGVRPQLIALIQTTLGVFMLLPFTSLEKVPLVGSHWYYLLGLGVIHTGIVYILMYSSYQKLTTPAIAVLSFVNPASAIFSDFVIYGHMLEPIQGVGFALIVLGSLAVNFNLPLFPTRRTGRASAYENSWLPNLKPLSINTSSWRKSMPCVQKDLSIAVVGATGIVGTTFLSLFEERGFEYSSLHLVASSRSAGRSLTVRDRSYHVCDLADFDFTGVDIAFFAAGTPISREWVGKAVRQGALVIDNTNAFRMDPDTPLVVPQVNRHLLGERPKSGIVANPNCSTIPLVRILQPIEQRYRVKRVIASTYQAASGRGFSGIEELKNGSLQIIKTPSEPPEAKRFPIALAFDLIPSIDVVLDSLFTLEEQKMLQESRKILNRPDLEVSATCVRVPVINCHSEAVYFECDRDLDRDDIVELLRQAPEVTVHDGEGTAAYPTPRTIDDPDRVHVGRIRIDVNNPKAGWFWLVSDNLRIGAALNAIQIAEEMIQRKVI